MHLFMGDQIVSQSDYLGITEAAEYLRVSASTLRRWEKKGFLIPERTPTGIRRYTKQQLDAVLQQGPQLLSEDDSFAPSSYDQPSQSFAQTVSSYEPQYSYSDVQPTHEYTESVETVESPESEPEASTTSSYVHSQQDSFISSHRHTPPPAYTTQSTPKVTSSYSPYDRPFSSPIKMPEDDIQSSINELSSVYQHTPTPPPKFDLPRFTPPVHHDASAVEPYHETFVKSPEQPVYSAPVPPVQSETVSSYADDYSFEEDNDLEEPMPIAQTMPGNVRTKEDKPSKSVAGGFAMFLGVFVGILIITAGIWFGFMYFSGGMGNASLLSPVP